jgi:RNA polymerase sigma factor (sigma-70 family)
MVVTFEDFVVARVPVLVRTAAALSGDLALAEDLVQEVMIKVLERWDQISRLDARDSYVRRMLVNEYLSWRRKWARIVPLADLEPIDGDHDRSNHPGHNDPGHNDPGHNDPGHLASVHADRDLLRAQLSRLPRRRQVVLALRYYGDLSDAEIAETLGCRVSTVRSLASRALASLRIDATLRAEFTTELIPVEEGHVT